MKKIILSIVLVSVCSHVSAKSKGDADNGKKLAAQGYCYTCHGDNGVAPSRNAPSLAGQGKKYLYATLKDYKKKKLTIDNKSLGMQGIVQPMSKSDMHDLAAFYSEQELPRKARGKMPEVVDDNCSSCHNEDGTPAKKGKYPGLSGMSAAYIHRQVQAYKDGHRVHKKMDPEDLNELSESELEEIVRFYSN